MSIGRSLVLALLVALPALAGCTDPEEGEPPAWVPPEIRADGCFTADTVPLAHPEPTVVFETSMGTVEAEVFTQLVPVTAQHFLDLVEAGHYDGGIPFHRIMTDFMMQGGNGALAPDGPRNASVVPDEFHHRLRHDQKGLLSMANAGPNTGSDQFFITFKATPWLDDWHTVFGRVTSGLDVLDRVNAEAASTGGTPRQNVTLERATVRAAAPAQPLPVDFGVIVPDAQQMVGTDGGRAAFTVLVESCTDHRVDVTVEATADGAEVAPADGFAGFGLPGAQRRVFAVHADVPSGNARTVPVEIVLRAGDVERRVEVGIERASGVGENAVASGDGLRAHYIGMLTDGRLFDTSLQEVADEPRIPKFAAVFGARARGDTFTFTAGGGVVQGFTDLAVGTVERGTNAGAFPPEKGYGAQIPPGQTIFTANPLTGKPLFFQLEVVEIVSP